jgi:hypothetical protein
VSQLIDPITRLFEDIASMTADRNTKSGGLPPRANQNEKSDYIQSNNPIVHRSHKLERLVLEALNKLQTIHKKPEVYLSPRAPVQAPLERTPIEIEFKRKKLHFVSD